MIDARRRTKAARWQHSPAATRTVSLSVASRTVARMPDTSRKKSLLAVLLLLVVVSCGRGQKDLSDVTVGLRIEPEPPQIGPATITITLSNPAGQPIRGAEVELEGNMSHAGMVPVFAQASEVDPGTYRANLEFTMGGDWFILVRAELPDGRSMERKVDVPGVDVVCGDTPQP